MSPFTIMRHIMNGTTTDRDARWAVIWVVVWTLMLTVFVAAVFMLQGTLSLS